MKAEGVWTTAEALCMKREALLDCLETIKGRHHVAWARTSADIAIEVTPVIHAFADHAALHIRIITGLCVITHPVTYCWHENHPGEGVRACVRVCVCDAAVVPTSTVGKAFDHIRN